MLESFYEFYQKMENEFSETVAFRWVDTDGKSVCSRTYSEYCADIRRYVSYLKEQLGDPSGKHVAILAGTGYEYFVVLFAGFLTDCVTVPLNYQKDMDEILDEMERADVTAVIYSADILDWLPELPEKAPGKLIDLLAYKDSPESEIEDVGNLESLATILYTSGTTGKSKGVMLSRKNLLYSVWNKPNDVKNLLFREFLHTEYYVFFFLSPMFHISGFKGFDPLSIGCTLHICKSVKYFYRDIALMPSTCTSLVPVFFSALLEDLKNGRGSRMGTVSVFCTASASADIEALSYLIDHGYYIEQRYALTETAGVGTINNSQESEHMRAIGQAEDINEIKLDHGEICFKGDTVFMGYYKDPEATAEVFDEDGWFHTGDLARVDEEGYYYLTGRKKNLIILASGENVSPEELEARLLDNTDITEVVVKEKNSRIAAEIFCAAEKQQEIESFVTELNKTLPTYKFIAEIEFRDKPFERTSTGKIRR